MQATDDLLSSTAILEAIALVLKVEDGQIKSFQEWDKVYFVRFLRGRPTFVSKRKVKMLAGLQGSEKQIRWAKDIRQRTIEQFEAKYVDEYSQYHLKKGRCQVEINKEINAFRTAFEEVVLSHTSAKWWIENRDYILNKQVRNQIQEVVNSLLVNA